MMLFMFHSFFYLVKCMFLSCLNDLSFEGEIERMFVHSIIPKGIVYIYIKISPSLSLTFPFSQLLIT